MENFIFCAVSPIFLWKSYGIPQFLKSFERSTQNFHIRKLDEISVFYTVPTSNWKTVKYTSDYLTYWPIGQLSQGGRSSNAVVLAEICYPW